MISSLSSFLPENHACLVDRGAFLDLDISALESRPWLDSQTLDLFGRASKAARMYNVLAAAFMNISLPLNSSSGIFPRLRWPTGHPYSGRTSGRGHCSTSTASTSWTLALNFSSITPLMAVCQ